MREVRARLQKQHFIKLEIPEYHDEQPFPIWTGGIPNPATLSPAGSFGPIVNIFASPFLDDFKLPWQFAEHGDTGVFVAAVFVDAPSGTMLSGSYAALSLHPGMNCLWLALQMPGTWTASISQATSIECDRKAPRFPLRVDPTAPSPRFDDHPPAASFGHTIQGEPLFGVKCLSGWCEIGPPAMGWSAGGSTGTPSLPVRTRKGWYDEQWLSVAGASGTLVPALYAAVYPAIDIASRGVDGFSDWRFVASVMLGADPAPGTKYATWGLRRGENAIFMRKSGGGWQTARIDPSTAHQVLSGVIPFTPPTQLLKTDRMPHHDAGVPGTARWRFASMDEGLWVPCGQACCRAEMR